MVGTSTVDPVLHIIERHIGSLTKRRVQALSVESSKDRQRLYDMGIDLLFADPAVSTSAMAPDWPRGKPAAPVGPRPYLAGPITRLLIDQPPPEASADSVLNDFGFFFPRLLQLLAHHDAVVVDTPTPVLFEYLQYFERYRRTGLTEHLGGLKFSFEVAVGLLSSLAMFRPLIASSQLRFMPVVRPNARFLEWSEAVGPYSRGPRLARLAQLFDSDDMARNVVNESALFKGAGGHIEQLIRQRLAMDEYGPVFDIWLPNPRLGDAAQAIFADLDLPNLVAGAELSSARLTPLLELELLPATPRTVEALIQILTHDDLLIAWRRATRRAVAEVRAFGYDDSQDTARGIANEIIREELSPWWKSQKPDPHPVGRAAKIMVQSTALGSAGALGALAAGISSPAAAVVAVTTNLAIGAGKAAGGSLRDRRAATAHKPLIDLLDEMR